MKTFKVKFTETGSGGIHKLNHVDYDELYDLGWDINYEYRYATKEFRCFNEDVALNAAYDDFERATCYSWDEEGCFCCGRPFNFYVSELVDEIEVEDVINKIESEIDEMLQKANNIKSILSNLKYKDR